MLPLRLLDWRAVLPVTFRLRGFRDSNLAIWSWVLAMISVRLSSMSTRRASASARRRSESLNISILACSSLRMESAKERMVSAISEEDEFFLRLPRAPAAAGDPAAAAAAAAARVLPEPSMAWAILLLGVLVILSGLSSSFLFTIWGWGRVLDASSSAWLSGRSCGWSCGCC